MARTNKIDAAKNDYIEFSFEGENGNEFSGRIYEKSSSTDNADFFPLSITINGLAIVGSKLVDGKKGAFVSLPSYKAKNGDYKQQCYFYNKEDMKDMEDLGEYLKQLIIEANK